MMEAEVGMLGSLALKVEKGAMNQGMQATSRHWKRTGKRFSPGASRGNRAPLHLDFSPVRLVSDF